MTLSSTIDNKKPIQFVYQMNGRVFVTKLVCYLSPHRPQQCDYQMVVVVMG